ncbi:transglutaminase family protein [Paenibacillus sp. N3.4]|uniref:transglutaminase-like domain-containing protein n=1 Tax=Paenibacillus sp. N3.4 TaxID=2603222 RepID=UPI0011C9DEFA|nr:transglutaminase-like domain-containing protein [Paenibacillus sp. N3.4]TXK77836.1 transglutaminase domain-containing protein [Paenibacillus sp. N3.4]
MFKKTFVITLLVAFFLMLAPKGTYAASSIVDKSSLDKGIFTVNYTVGKDAKAIVRITKENVKFDYNLVKGAQYPLQLGDGSYNVLIAELVSNNKYKVVAQENIDVKMENQNVVFLQSIPLIDWNNETKAVVKAKKLTAAAKSDADKIAAIYSYLTQTFTYDYDKVQTVEAGYTPNLDEIYQASKGICYDYAATFAAMARSQGIPTRLVMGYEVDAPDTYHAWNQVYLQDSKEWVTIDTTYDAVRVQGGQDTPMFKAEADYTITKIY